MIENAWLDKIDVYYLQKDLLINSFHTGDHLLFAERPLIADSLSRVMILQGETTILIRVESADAMVLPIYLLDNEKLNDRDRVQAYSYGFMYGVILALVAYNFMLYIGLRAAPYLLYSLYLLFFLALNAAYTGHGYQWLWSESPQWQQWANPVLMMACTVSGFAFALHFLAIKVAWPRVYRLIIVSCAGFSALILLAMLVDEFVLALLISIVFIFFFTLPRSYWAPFRCVPITNSPSISCWHPFSRFAVELLRQTPYGAHPIQLVYLPGDGYRHDGGCDFASAGTRRAF